MAAIEMHPVDSDAIKSAGHDGANMHVAWKSGTSSTHMGVPADTFNAFLAASSKGKFFHARIRAQHPGVAK